MLITIKNIIGAIRNVLGIVTDELKMWLPFERSDIVSSTQVAPDTSGNSNNATLYTGKALSFDGVNDYVDIGDTSSNTNTIAITFVLDSEITHSDSGVCLTNLTGTGFSGIFLGSFTGTLTNELITIVDGSSVKNSYETTTDSISAGVHRLVMVYNSTSSNYDIYLDGVQKTLTSSPSVNVIPADNILLGRRADGVANWFEGKLSDVQIYNTTWTQADVTYDYNKPNHLVTDNPSTSIALSNLKGYWALSEGSGSITYDSSGEGNDGTINGATYVNQQSTIPQLGMMDWSKGSNLYLNSEPTSDEGSASNITYASYSWNYRQFDNATVFGDNSAVRYRYGGTVSPSTEHTLSAFVIMDDNSEPNISNNSGSGDFSIVLKGTVSSGVNSKTNVSGNIWRISKTLTTTSGTSLTTNNGIIKYSTQSSKGFRVVGWQLEESSSPTAYRRTNGTAVTDATLISSPNNPSQDILGNSVRLREHSFNLDGSGYAEVADADSLDMSSGFSTSFWVKLDEGTTTSDYKFLVCKGRGIGGTNTAFGFGTTHYDNKLIATINTSVSKYQVTSSSQNPTGQWLFVCVTYEPNTTLGLKLYLDDNLPDSITVSGTVDESHNLSIGQDSSLVASRYSKNIIDDVLFYNKALSAEEVERNYKVGEVSHKTGSSFSDDFSGDYGN